MGEYSKFEVIAILGVIPFILTCIECLHYTLTYKHLIIWQDLLMIKILLLSIPILFIVSVIVKILKPNDSFGDILLEIYGPILIWVCLLSLVSKG